MQVRSSNPMFANVVAAQSPDFRRRKTGLGWRAGFMVIAPMLALVIASPRYAHGWSIDLSRRNQETRQTELRQDSNPANQAPSANRLMQLLTSEGRPSDSIDIVILQTSSGFVPQMLRVRSGQKYTIHLVNVNEAEKNVSFVLDGFGEQHATFFGHVKRFELAPQKEGVFSFFSPETSAEGRLVVLGSGAVTPMDRMSTPVPATSPGNIPPVTGRSPASAGGRP